MDLGFRLADIGGLEREPVSYGRTDPQHNLSYNGATEEEIAILVNRASGRAYSSERVELNAMMANEFVGWIDRKLQAAGVNTRSRCPGIGLSARPRREAITMSKNKNGLPDGVSAGSPSSGESRSTVLLSFCATPIVNENAGGVKPPAA